MTEDKTDFNKVTDFDNLYNAYKKSKRGKGFSKSKLKFEMAALDGISQIKKLLESGNYIIDPYNEFKVYEPKLDLLRTRLFSIVYAIMCCFRYWKMNLF